MEGNSRKELTMTTIYYNNQHLQVHIKESQLFGGINWGWIDLTDSKGFQYTNATIMPYWIETANKLDLIDELETLYAIQDSENPGLESELIRSDIIATYPISQIEWWGFQTARIYKLHQRIRKDLS